MQSENEKKSWTYNYYTTNTNLTLSLPPSLPGKVKVWDPRQKEEPVACMEPAEGDTHRDCWTVTFGQPLRNISKEKTCH